jgi:biotin operon repressor
MINGGWVKNYRKIDDWEWYTTPNMAHIYQHLIRRANHQDGKWRGVDIKKGQLVTGRLAIAEQTGVSQQSVRTCLKRLEDTGEIIVKSTNKFSIITISKYEEYQSEEKMSNQQSTNNQPTTNHKQECKEEKEVKTCPVGDEGFARFYAAYPKKVAKAKALKAWKSQKCDKHIDEIMTSLPKHINSQVWQKQGGQFIPYPAAWLNARRWEDEIKGDSEWI